MRTNMQKRCAVIPVHGHECQVTELVTRLIVSGFDCVLVDNASAPECADMLDRLTRQNRVFLLRLRVKQDRGRAMLAGMREARQLGYTHALHADASEPYDLDVLPRFIRQSLAAPDAVICGYRVARIPGNFPAPGRSKLVQLATKISTLSLDMKDAACSFRIYPLETVLRLADIVPIGGRASVDVDILVRLHWRRQPMYWLPVRTRGVPERALPGDGWRDSMAAIRTHMRLLTGMLARAPQLLWCRWQG